MKKVTLKQIKEIVGDKYEIISYDRSDKPIYLKCPIHGIFKIRYDHLKEANEEICKECKKEKKRIEKFKYFEKMGNEIHNNKYMYHLDKFVKMTSKTIITCPIHGDFPQMPVNHIDMKQGCPHCANDKKIGNFKYTRKEIIEMCKKTHGDEYIYDDVIFQGMKKKLLNIYCKKHGYFNQVAYDHIRGFKCEKCKFENQTMTKEEFINRASLIHNGFYLYDEKKINYVNNHIKIPIICPIHGEFWQTPSYHLIGGGCQLCNTSKLEKEILYLLDNNSIKYLHKHHDTWLGKLELDFYLPEYNIGIECQGLQHFESVKRFGGVDELNKVIERDKRKLSLCIKNGVKLLYYSNLGINYPYYVFEDKELLLKEIKGTT